MLPDHNAATLNPAADPPESVEPRARDQRRKASIATCALLGAAAVGLYVATFAPLLRVPGLYAYPFISFDGFQWIGEGLVWLGLHDQSYGRYPGYPSLAVVLVWLRQLDLAIWINPAALAVFCFYVYRLVRLVARPELALATVLIVLSNARVTGAFLWILADPLALAFMTAACFHLCRAVLQTRSFGPFLFFAGMSALFQSAIFFSLVGAAVAYLWLTPSVRGALQEVRSQWWRLLLAAVPLLLCAAWYAFGPPSKVVHAGLVRFNLNGVLFYLWSTVAMYGWLGAYAMFALVRPQAGANRVVQVVFLFTAPQLLFWTFFYTWHDVRFGLYFAPLALVALALLLERTWGALGEALRQRAWTTIAGRLAVVLVGLSALQYPVDSLFNQHILPLTSQLALSSQTQSYAGVTGNQTVSLVNLKLDFRHEGTVLLQFPKLVARKVKDFASSSQPMGEILSAARAGASRPELAAMTDRVRAQQTEFEAQRLLFVRTELKLLRGSNATATDGR